MDFSIVSSIGIYSNPNPFNAFEQSYHSLIFSILTSFVHTVGAFYVMLDFKSNKPPMSDALAYDISPFERTTFAMQVAF